MPLSYAEHLPVDVAARTPEGACTTRSPRTPIMQNLWQVAAMYASQPKHVTLLLRYLAGDQYAF
jgi:hypothetical protein